MRQHVPPEQWSDAALAEEVERRLAGLLTGTYRLYEVTGAGRLRRVRPREGSGGRASPTAGAGGRRRG